MPTPKSIMLISLDGSPPPAELLAEIAKMYPGVPIVQAAGNEGSPAADDTCESPFCTLCTATGLGAAAVAKETPSEAIHFNVADVISGFNDDDLITSCALVGITSEGAVRVASSHGTGLALNAFAQGINVLNGATPLEDNDGPCGITLSDFETSDLMAEIDKRVRASRG